MPSYESTLDYLFSLQNSGIKLGLERIEALTQLLAFPYKDYPTVLIAGTNGKGSVSAMLASMLGAAGFRVGLYTSPHLKKFNERVRVDGEMISDAELVELTLKIRALVEGEGSEEGLPPELSPTFFEFTTALAFLYFQARGVDIAILEVGMGGRLDATNVTEPLLSIITSIGLDHISSLGSDIAQVAGEKGGIIKRGSTVLSALLPTQACEVIERISTKQGANLIKAGEDFKILDEPGSGFTYIDSVREITGLRCALYGAHQRLNAALAIRAMGELREAGFNSTSKDIRRGLLEAHWPGRCEIVKDKPQVLLDCAHNESAARALSEALDGFTYSRLILVLGIMADKDIVAILGELAGRADHIIMTAPDVQRAESPERLLKSLGEIIRARDLTLTSSISKSVDKAIGVALDKASDNDLICISGSVFTVGEARNFFEQL